MSRRHAEQVPGPLAVSLQRSCTRILVQWGPQSRELSSLEALHFWRMCNRAVRIRTLRYRNLDVSGQVGTFTYNGILTADDGWWVSMIIENTDNPIRALHTALRERDKSLGRPDRMAQSRTGSHALAA